MSSNDDVRYVITLHDGTPHTMAGDNLITELSDMLHRGSVQLDSQMVRRSASGQHSSRPLAGFIRWKISDRDVISGADIEAVARSRRLSPQDVLQSAVGEFTVEEVIQAMRRSSHRPSDQIVMAEPGADIAVDADSSREVGLPPTAELDDADRPVRDDGGPGHVSPEPEAPPSPHRGFADRLQPSR